MINDIGVIISLHAQGHEELDIVCIVMMEKKIHALNISLCVMTNVNQLQ